MLTNSKLSAKQFAKNAVLHCLKIDESLKTRNVIDVAIRDFNVSNYDNHFLYYQIRWYIYFWRKEFMNACKEGTPP